MASIYDNFRSATAKRFAKFGVAATVTAAGEPLRDVITGTVTPGVAVTATGLAVLGKRRLVATDGTVRVQSTARLSIPAESGNTLAVGTRSFKITTVEEINPDGGEPMLWLAVLQ